MHATDRSTGTFFFTFGLLLYFVLIPSQVEPQQTGWILPDTVPNALAMIIAACGGLLVVFPSGQRVPDSFEFLSGLGFLTLITAGVYVISLVGFMIAAPFIALAIMLAVGERRPIWLAAGALATPGVIWFVVSFLLGRPLP